MFFALQKNTLPPQKMCVWLRAWLIYRTEENQY